MLFASLMLCSAVYVFFLVPETKSIPLEKMNRLFSDGIPARKAHKVVMAELRADESEFRRNSLIDQKVDEAYTIDEKRVERV
jgi:uncharacterized protein YoaH (UPF0181 family)